MDQSGNVYTGVGDGVDVYEPSGRLIGKIYLPGGVANLAFCTGGGGDGKKVKNRLFMMQEKKVTAVDLNTRGVDLPEVVLGQETQWEPLTPSANSEALPLFGGRRRSRGDGLQNFGVSAVVVVLI